MSPELALQKALMAHLRADAGVTALVDGNVHEAEPDDRSYPMVTLTRMETRPWGGLPTDGMIEGTEHILTLTINSNFDGTEEVKAIIAALRVALDGAGLSLDGHRLVNIRPTFADAFRATGHAVGVVRVRAVVEPL